MHVHLADAKPRFRDLQNMTYLDEDGKHVQFRLMERMRPHIRQVAIALGFPHHDIIRTSDPVFHLLSKWLQGDNQEDPKPVTWGTLITVLRDAKMHEEAKILEKYIVAEDRESVLCLVCHRIYAVVTIKIFLNHVVGACLDMK